MAEAQVFLTRRYMISAMHVLSSPSLSAEENRSLYGKCCNIHGHDYRIEVTVVGVIDPMSGLSCDRDRLDKLVEKVLIEPFHKSNLNKHFKNTTGEALARAFFELLQLRLKPLKIARVRVQETPRNFFTWGDPSLFPDGLLLG